MANPYKGLKINIAGNTRSLTTALNEAKRPAKGTTKELKELHKAKKAIQEKINDLLEIRKQSRIEQLDILDIAMEQLGEQLTDEQLIKIQSEICLLETQINH